MKKNTTFLAIALIVLLAFTGCSKNDNGADTATPTPVVEENVTETPEDTTGEDAATEEAPTEEAPAEDEEAGALVSNETLDAIHQKVVALVGEENYVANMPYDTATLSELFGIDSTWYDAAIAEGPMMSVHVDKFVAIHATEGNVENVAKALNEYRDVLVADTMQYPMNVAKIQGSVVETVGDYVFFSMVGSLDIMDYPEESDLIDAYTEINTQVIDIAKEEIGA